MDTMATKWKPLKIKAGTHERFKQLQRLVAVEESKDIHSDELLNKLMDKFQEGGFFLKGMTTK